MWKHYVYLHRRDDTGEPFYVGKGTHRLRDKQQSFERAHARDSRSRWWQNIANKAGVTVYMVASCQSDAAAQRLEKAMIADIGRRDLGLGPLVNITDGGDGHAGIIASKELRQKRSENAAGPRSGAWVQSIRAARKNGGNGGVVKQGDKLPAEWAASIAIAKVGAKNPYYGKLTPVSKKVMNTATGIIYDSIARAAAAEGLNAKTLYQYLDGARLNKTPLVRV